MTMASWFVVIPVLMRGKPSRLQNRKALKDFLNNHDVAKSNLCADGRAYASQRLALKLHTINLSYRASILIHLRAAAFDKNGQLTAVPTP